MFWNIFEILGGILEVLDLLSDSSGPNWRKNDKSRKRKTFFLIKLISSGLIVAGVILLLIIFRKP